jgi:regulation of enolase protein 1 (concanavalin A-like superfamily)
MSDVSLPALPMPLAWHGDPARWEIAPGGELTIEAGAQTDWFIDPEGVREPRLDAPALLAGTSGDFILSARVQVDFSASFDAGVLALYGDDRTWAKLCFEYSPDGEPMVVSVVTRGVSDDCNSTVVDGRDVWLRVARCGPAVAFHASVDGERWSFVRHFALDAPADLAAGFLAQSPTGDGCAVSFTEIAYEPTRLADLRSGA